jgi:hypothetical protein
LYHFSGFHVDHGGLFEELDVGVGAGVQVRLIDGGVGCGRSVVDAGSRFMDVVVQWWMLVQGSRFNRVSGPSGRRHTVRDEFLVWLEVLLCMDSFNDNWTVPVYNSSACTLRSNPQKCKVMMSSSALDSHIPASLGLRHHAKMIGGSVSQLRSVSLREVLTRPVIILPGVSFAWA